MQKQSSLRAGSPFSRCVVQSAPPPAFALIHLPIALFLESLFQRRCSDQWRFLQRCSLQREPPSSPPFPAVHLSGGIPSLALSAFASAISSSSPRPRSFLLFLLLFRCLHRERKPGGGHIQSGISKHQEKQLRSAVCRGGVGTGNSFEEVRGGFYSSSSKITNNSLVVFVSVSLVSVS